jgi:hypothetical protein
VKLIKKCLLFAWCSGITMLALPGITYADDYGFSFVNHSSSPLTFRMTDAYCIILPPSGSGVRLFTVAPGQTYTPTGGDANNRFPIRGSCYDNDENPRIAYDVLLPGSSTAVATAVLYNGSPSVNSSGGSNAVIVGTTTSKGDAVNIFTFRDGPGMLPPQDPGGWTISNNYGTTFSGNFTCSQGTNAFGNCGITVTASQNGQPYSVCPGLPNSVSGSNCAACYVLNTPVNANSCGDAGGGW